MSTPTDTNFGTTPLTLGGRIREARTRKGLTQRDLSDRTGLTQQAISSIEQDRFNPSLGTLRRIASSLDITAADLMREPIAA